MQLTDLGNDAEPPCLSELLWPAGADGSAGALVGRAQCLSLASTPLQQCGHHDDGLICCRC